MKEILAARKRPVQDVPRGLLLGQLQPAGAKDLEQVAGLSFYLLRGFLSGCLLDGLLNRLVDHLVD